MTKMIPPAPTSAVLMPTPKQKIGFSIESIVGNDAGATSPNAVGSDSRIHHNNTNEHIINNNNNNNNSSNSNGGSNNSNNNSHNTSASGPGSPPQTPPAGAMGSSIMGATHLPGATQLTLPLSLPLNPHGHLHPAHTHLPPHLSPAQQHALHQHLLLQQHQQQQQQQQLSQQQQHQHHHHHTRPLTPKAIAELLPHAPMRPDIQDIIQRLHSSAAAAAAANLSINAGPYSPPMQTQTPTNLPTAEDAAAMLHLKRERSPVPANVEEIQNPAHRHQPNQLTPQQEQQQQQHQQLQQQQQQQPQAPHTPPKSVSPQSSHPASPPAIMPGSPAAMPLTQSPQQLQQHFAKHTHGGMPPGAGPLLMPGMSPAHHGLVRPFPVVGPGGVPPPPPQQGLPDIKALPPYINAPPPELPPQHNPHLIAAAQFQMAAALQAGHVLGPAAAAAAAAGLPPHASPFMGAPGMPRDSYPLYPWLLSRHGRIFPHRFPGNFLLQPFRKPKRIRTAFSPSQLLKLEHAFESNQYVVGAERKALAQSLNLSETQVKVWFQNRRTKHKRMQQEDEKGGGDGASSERSKHNISCDEDDDDELIDMEMDDCGSDDEHELDTSQ